MAPNKAGLKSIEDKEDEQDKRFVGGVARGITCPGVLLWLPTYI
jgi:hypothetical protein